MSINREQREIFVKKIALLLCFVAGASLSWAGDMDLGEEKFLSWIKGQAIAGYEVDEESFENYDDREFTIDFMSSGAPAHLSVKMQAAGEMAEIKGQSQVQGNSPIGEYTEATVGKRKAAYWTMTTMKNVSFMNVAIPEVGAELRLLTSPAKSADEMRTIVEGLDLEGLK